MEKRGEDRDKDEPDEDPFWTISLNTTEHCGVLKSRQNIVPDRDDENVNIGCFSSHKNLWMNATYCRQYSIISPCSELSYSQDDDNICVTVTEVCGNGILDVIGGEVWEASLLLCAYLAKYFGSGVFPRTSNTCRILELGSGIGLPAFYLIHRFLHPSSRFFKTDCNIKVCFSDYDTLVLENLDIMLNDHFDLNKDQKNMRNDQEVITEIRWIDWNNYVAHGNSEHSAHAFHQINQETSGVYKDDFDIIFGSALCYAPYHICLVDLVKYYLVDGSCKKIIILQIKDREGFQTLISKMQELNIDLSIEDIPEDVFSTAQQIGVSKGTVNEPFSSRETTNAKQNSRDELSSFARVFKHFDFPNNYFNCEFGDEGNFNRSSSNDDLDTRSDNESFRRNDKIKRGLIRSDINCFQILIATKK